MPTADQFARLALAVGIAVVIGGCGDRGAPISSPPGDVPGDQAVRVIDMVRLRPQVAKFCGSCHAVPHPSTFPKRAWRKEVLQGYRFYEAARRGDLSPPPHEDVIAYYERLAPKEVRPAPPPSDPAGPSPVRFEQRPVRFPQKEGFISHLLWNRRAPRELLVCDMRLGGIHRLREFGKEPKPTLLSRLWNPAHVEPYDLDRDGRMDYLVADLGSFEPKDHSDGQVVWLRARKDRKGFDHIVLKAGLGRVADVRAADFDGDGKTDLVVAEFGWRTTGRILLLRQTGVRDGVPRFETRILDSRHGTIHVPIADLNGDGRPDFVALISQEHEVVEAFLNRGDGTFETRRIFQAGDPSFGSSGIELVDLDGDGDLDVLYTNGDSFDSFFIKPYHAVHWLENRGTFPFVAHELTRLPGASRAVACDLDGDGLLDVVATAYVPRRVLAQTKGRFDSLIWLRQVKKGVFRRYGLDRSKIGHLALSIGDFDDDGRPDIAVSNNGRERDDQDQWMTIWFNRSNSSALSP
jgi:FG-GAP-like repeat/Dihaem cytochrome c